MQHRGCIDGEDSADAIVDWICDEKVPLAIQGDRGRPAQAGRRGEAAIAAESLSPVAGHRADTPGRGYFANSIVARIRN